MMSSQLFNAVLSMDAYNRGYNAGIKFGNDPGDYSIDTQGTQLGAATIIRNKGDADAQASNFYGVAYNYDTDGDGTGDQIIISYRGTDDPLGTITESFFGGDIWDGWTAGVGNDDAQQAELAIRFYQDVVEQVEPTFTDYTNNGVVLTGHSLGGGLAGYIGGIYANEAYAFDNMAFELAADNTYNSTNTELLNLVYPTGSYSPDFSKVEATSIEWEVLADLPP